MRQRDLRHLRRVAAAADWGEFDAKLDDEGDEDSPDDDHDGYQPIRQRANNGLCGVDGWERKQSPKRRPADDQPATVEELLARIGREQRKGEK